MTAPTKRIDAPDDLLLMRRFAARDPAAVRRITEANNQRLYRVAWSILKHRAEAEDVVQSTYLRAFAAAGDFEGRSSVSTWLTRIAINEALERKRSAMRRLAGLDSGSVAVLDDYRNQLMRGSMNATHPDEAVARQQVRTILEAAIAGLPDDFRTVFVLREIEGLGVDEVAGLLGLRPATVKTRALRARRRLQDALAPRLKSVLTGAFPFAGADCAAMSERVLRHICRPADPG